MKTTLCCFGLYRVFFNDKAKSNENDFQILVDVDVKYPSEVLPALKAQIPSWGVYSAMELVESNA